MLTTMLLLVVELMLGAGNWPLMRMPCWGTPRGEMVPYVTFQVKNRYGSSARATVAAATRHRRDTNVSRSIPRSLIGLPLHPLLHSSSQDYVIGFFFLPFSLCGKKMNVSSSAISSRMPPPSFYTVCSSDTNGISTKQTFRKSLSKASSLFFCPLNCSPSSVQSLLFPNLEKKIPLSLSPSRRCLDLTR